MDFDLANTPSWKGESGNCHKRHTGKNPWFWDTVWSCRFSSYCFTGASSTLFVAHEENTKALQFSSLSNLVPSLRRWVSSCSLSASGCLVDILSSFLSPSVIFQLFIGHFCLHDPPVSQTPQAWNWTQMKMDSSLSSSDPLVYSQSHEVITFVINSSRPLQSLKNLPIPHLFFPNPVLIWDLILPLNYWNHVLAVFLDPILLPASLHPVHCCQGNLKPLVQLSLFWLSTSICTRFLTSLGLANKTPSFYSHSVYRPLIPNQTLSLCEEKT